MESVRGLSLTRRAVAVVFAAAALATACYAQTANLVSEDEAQSSAPQTPVAQTPAQTKTPQEQPERPSGLFPNYRVVNADSKAPVLTAKAKFVLASHVTFNYSSILVVAGGAAGIKQAQNAVPEFHQGAAGYGRYYWHTFADEGIANYFTAFIVPSLTHEDPRYYVRGHGGFFKRTGYAVTRVLITPKDSGGNTFNFSEIAGTGAATSISSLYYPQSQRTWTKIGQKWAATVAVDAAFNVFNEFWPNVRHKLFGN